MSRLQEDLKIIVGIKDIENRLTRVENKQAIPAQFGSATQIDNLGQDSNKTSVDGAVGPDYAPPTTDGEDLLNGTAPLAPGDQLKGLDNIFDCDSGKEIEIREDGRPVPPVGWLTPSTPPEGSSGEGTFAGFWFTGTSGTGSTTSNNYLEVVDWLIANTDIAENFVNWGVDGPPNPADLPTPGSNATKAYSFNVSRNDGNPGTFQLSITMERCDRSTELPPAGVTACSIEPDPPENWPTTDKFQLIRGKDGVLRSFELDPNVPPKYEEGQTTIDFCFGDGQHGRREATLGGGFMYYETDGAGGEPIGKAKIFGPDGVMVRNDVLAADVDLYQPKDF